jgi:PTH2 family peptidyl-tRNA hydrolase
MTVAAACLSAKASRLNVKGTSQRGDKGLSLEFEFKQVMAIRTDLAMGKGKLAAQVAHAAVASAKEAERRNPKWFNGWWREGQAKIVVKAGSESELTELKRAAEEMGLPNALVTDRGLTQIAPNTITCLGIGPAPARLVDQITGKLKLL